MQLYFIRHGQSGNNLLYHETGSFKGRSEDPDLTPVGVLQVEALANYLAQGPFQDIPPDGDKYNQGGYHLTHLYTSLMLRAVKTAVPVGNALNLQPVAWVDLHERGGIYLGDEQTGEKNGLPGKGRSYFEEHFPELLLPDDLTDAGWWNRPAEAVEEFDVRAQRVWHELLHRHGNTDDRVAFISHGGFFNSFLACTLNIPTFHPLPQGWPQNIESPGQTEYEHWLQLYNTAFTRIDLVSWGVELVYLNRFDFLPSHLVV